VAETDTASVLAEADNATRERRIRKAVGEAHSEIAKVMRQKGRYEGTMDVPGTGTVRLPFGTGGHWAPDQANKTHTDGWGLKKIREKHGAAALRDIPEVLLRGKSTPWEQDADFPNIKKKRFTFGKKIVVVSQKTGAPIVLTSFDPDAPEIHKSDLKRLFENRKPASLTVNRLCEEGGNGDATPCPTHAGLVNSLPGAVASKASNIPHFAEEIKA
jgi:hypothetical protein